MVLVNNMGSISNPLKGPEKLTIPKYIFKERKFCQFHLKVKSQWYCIMLRKVLCFPDDGIFSTNNVNLQELFVDFELFCIGIFLIWKDFRAAPYMS